MAAELRGWRISGSVQGVFFRASTRRQAESLGLTGYAVNLPDGRVEIAASGAAAALDRLHDWLQHGPPAARVDQVEVFEVDPAALRGGSFATG
jgi:acylphosphatase